MTERFTKRAGSEVLESIDDDCLTLIGKPVPHWVRLPDEIGGARVSVLGVLYTGCPACGDGGAPVEHYVCEDGYGVAECPTHAYVWYRVPQTAPEEMS